MNPSPRPRRRRAVAVAAAVALAVAAAVWLHSRRPDGDREVAVAALTVGDCVELTGSATRPHHRVVPCGSDEANFQVAIIGMPACAGYHYTYGETATSGDLGTTRLCLAPIFRANTCYDIDPLRSAPEAVDCAAPPPGTTDSFDPARRVHITSARSGTGIECSPGEIVAEFPEVGRAYCLKGS